MIRLPYSTRSASSVASKERGSCQQRFLPREQIPNVHTFLPLYPKTELNRRQERLDTLKGMVDKVSNVFRRGSLNFAASANTWAGPISMPQPEAPAENYVDRMSKRHSGQSGATFFERNNQFFSGLNPAKPPDRSLSTAASTVSSKLFPSEAPRRAVEAYRSPSVVSKSLLDTFFPNSSGAELASFQVALQKIQLSADSDRKPVLHALAVSSNGDLAFAILLLRRMQHGIDLRHDGKVPAGPGQSIESAAWRFAQLLSRNERGFSLLKALHPKHSRFGRAERIALQVGDEVVLFAGGQAHPAAIKLHLEHHPEVAESFAAKVHSVAQDMLKGKAALDTTEKGLVFAWEQGFRSDAPGSPLDLAKQRMAKFVGKSIPRLAASRYRSYISRLFGRKKSPLSPMKYGVNGANRSTAAIERTSLTNSMQFALDYLRKDVNLDPSAVLRDQNPAKALAALATLEYWGSQSVHYKRRRIGSLGIPLVVQEMRRILDRISPADKAREPEAFANMLDVTEAFEYDPKRALKDFPDIQQLFRIPLSIHRLEAWGRVRYLSADDVFWETVRSFNDVQQPAKLRLKVRSTGAAHEMLKNLIEKMQTSGRARFADGVRHGVNTKGLTVNLSHVLNLVGIPFGPRLTLAAQRSRVSTFEIGCARFAGEILIGTESKRRRTVGGGFIAGIDMQAGAAHVRCGAVVEATRSHEIRRSAGVMFRFIRRPNAKNGKPDDELMKQKMQKLIKCLFESKRTNKSAAQRDGLFNDLAEHFLDDPDFSMSWNSQEGNSTDHNASAGIGALFRVDGTRLRVGPSAVISAESSVTEQQNRQDQGGRIRAAFYRSSRSAEIATTIGLNGKIGGTTGPHHGVRGDDVGFFNAGLPDWVVPIYQRGQLSRAKLIRENGELVAKYCTLDREFSKFTDYRDTILAREHEWVALFSANFVDRPDPYYCARVALHDHLAEAGGSAKMNHTFIIRDRLSEAAAREIDENCAASDAIRLCTYLPIEKCEELCAAFEASSRALVADKSSWVGLDMKVVEKSGREHRHGLLLGLQATSDTLAEGERKLSTLNASLVKGARKPSSKPLQRFREPLN